LATKLKRMLCLILASFLFVLSVPAASMEVHAAGGISSDYKKVAESDAYEMYLYEPTLSIILKNKDTGMLIRSTLAAEDDDGANNNTWNAYMNSGIVLSAIKGTNDTYQVDLVSCANTINYTYNDTGFAAEIYFNEYQFGFTVNVNLEGDELVVEIPESSIQENGVDTYIGTVSVFPFMGYTYLDAQNGYMFIPDGNGALIYLDDKDKRYSSGFSQMVYGSDIGFTESTTEKLLWDKYRTVNDTQKVMAPVFGMVHSEDELAYLAIIEDGEERASIEAHPNGVMVDYNRCFAKFLVRRIYIQPLNNSNSGTMTKVEDDRAHMNMKVRYVLLSGEEADYAGMAIAYRNYLLNNGMVEVKDNSYKTRVDFLGSDREEFLIFKKAVTATTVDNIAEMYDELQAAGVSSLLTVYKGWQKGGLYDIPITKYKADSSIGGTDDLTDLIAESAEEGYDVYLYNSALRTNPDENNTTFNTVKKINKRKLEIETRDYVYDTFHYLLPSRSDALLDKFATSYTKEGVNNVALAGITNNLFSYSYNSVFYTRFDCADTYNATVNELAAGTNLILEAPFVYLWKNTEAFLDMPLGSSDYMYTDEEVPFFSMVLKGIVPMYSDYVNFEANKKEFVLQMVEAGVYPSFYLTYEDSSDLIYTNSADLYSTKYSTYKDTVVEYDAQFRALAAKTQDAMITDHEKLAEGVNKVTYDNGVVIYVNYNEQAVSVDGVDIEALSYKVGE